MGSSSDDRDGTVDRDSVRIAYRTHGRGDPPVLFVPEHLGAALVVLDGVGHCPQVTARDRVGHLLDGFLARSSDGEPSSHRRPGLRLR